MSFVLRSGFYLLFTFVFLHTLSAQTPFAETIRTADVPPAWPDCDPKSDCTKKTLDEYISKNLVMPPAAVAQDAGGVVMVEFVIEKNGSIGLIQALRDPGMGLGTAAIAVITKLKEDKFKFEPAIHKGKKVAFRYMSPVSFNLAIPAKEVAAKPVTTEAMPDVFDVAEVMPIYNGCEPSITDTVDCTFLKMISHIQTNMMYPDSARKAGIQGPVVVQFVVDMTGKVTQPKVLKGLGFGLDEEAMRIISMMPEWKPGLVGGNPVAVRMTVPIMFQAPKPEKE